VAALGEPNSHKASRSSFAAGMDMILADVLESARREHGPIDGPHACAGDRGRMAARPAADEPGSDWIHGIQHERAAVLAAQTAVLLASYLRLLGHAARSHSATCSEVDLNRLAVAAGLAQVDGTNPYLGRRYGLAAVTTTFALQPDAAAGAAVRSSTAGSRTARPGGWARARLKGALNRDPFARRDFHQGAFPFETLQAPRRAHHLHRPRARAALPQARRLLRPRAVR
jgi:hypothetical protein